MAMAETRARPASSQTIPVYLPDESQIEPIFNLSDLEIECLRKSDPEEMPVTGRRIPPPSGGWDPGPTGRLLLAGALIVVLIVIIISLLMNWQET
jgi:hypothetical protein